VKSSFLVVKSSKQNPLKCDGEIHVMGEIHQSAGSMTAPILHRFSKALSTTYRPTARQ
jgi:hypothetical protein